MKRRVFHILPPDEPFSAFDGGAISRWVGSTIRADDSGIVVCVRSDASWGFPSCRVRPLPALRHFKGRSLLTRLLSLSAIPYRMVVSQSLFDLSAGDVVWVHNSPLFATFLSDFVRRRGASLALHMHNSIKWRNAEKLHWVMAVLSRHSTVFVSHFLESETLKDHELTRTFVLHNGADGARFAPLPFNKKEPRDEKIIAFSGRLIPEKGIHILLEAMRLLEVKNIPVRCLIAGTSGFGSAPFNEYASELRAKAPSNVEFLGYCSTDRLSKLLQEADAFCCPSVWNDPFPLSNLEAMACGLPVIASAVGGIPEALCHGGGILVDAGDPQQLSEAIESVVMDNERRRTLASQSRSVFEARFTWEHVFTNYKAIVDEVGNAV